MRTYSPLKFLLGVLGLLNSHDEYVASPTCPAHLEVIGAGLSKTGTQSTKFAFESLGYKVYNVESMMYYKHLDLVTSIYESTTLEERHEKIKVFNSKILETGSTVVLDIPCNFLYKELFELNPQAQVLLTTRDTAQKWTQSIQKTFHAFAPLITWPYSWFFDLETYSRMIWFKECEHGIDVWRPWFLPWVKIAHRYYMTDESKCRSMYETHIQDVQAIIPPTQLVLYNVKEGWPKLVRMLNYTNSETLPPFPNVNQGADMDTISFFTRFVAYTYPFLVMGAICAAPYILFFFILVQALFMTLLLHCLGCFE